MVSMRLLSPQNKEHFDSLTSAQRREFREFAEGERTSADIEVAHDLLNAHFIKWLKRKKLAEPSDQPSNKGDMPPPPKPDSDPNQPPNAIASHAVGGYVRHHHERAMNSSILRMAH